MYQILRSSHDAEDITSEFFLKLWRVADTYCFGGKHKRWLVTIARNMALDFLKRQKREKLLLDGDTGENTVPEPADSVSTEDTVTGRMSVAEALNALDESEREIVNMHILAELTFREIAAIVEKPIGTVTWKYRNAVTKLQKIVGEAQSV